MRLPSLLAILSALPVAVAAQTEAEDEGFLTEFIEENLSATARQVDIQGFAGALSSRATIDRLTIADAEGIWLEATDLALDWNRSALLGGRVEVEDLTAGSIEVLRAPIPDPQAPTPEATPFSLPELPVSIEIGELAARRIVLGEALLGEELVLTLDGSVDLSGGEGEAQLLAEIVEGSVGSLSLGASYSNETRVLAVNLDLQEEEGGLVARALDLPGLPSVALTVQGTAPIDDYAAGISLATAGQERFAGDFALKTTATENGEVTSRAFGLDVAGDVTPLVAPEVAEFLGPDVRLRTKGIRREDGSLVLTSLGIEAEALNLSGRAEITPQGWPARLDLQGSIGREDGTPVPLPGAADTTVAGVTLDVDYDRSQGEAWTGTFALDRLDRPGLSIDALTLDGGGTIQPATETAPGAFTADLDYAAQGLAFADAAVAEALGADLTGNIDLLRPSDGGPLQVRGLTLDGPGLQARAEGTIAGSDESFLTQSSITFEAEDLARFAELSGLDLGGSANATVVSAVRPLDGIFELALSGTTDDLELGIAELDPLLAGAGAVALSAARDEAGLRIDRLDLSTDAITADATADISSGESQAEFDLAVTDLGLAFPELSGPATVSGTFSREATGAAILDADATLPGATLAVDATQAASSRDARGDAVPGPITFEAQAEAEELSRYQPLLATLAPDFALTPSGAATVRLSGTTEADLDTFDVTVSAQTQDLALGIDPLDAALAGQGSLSGRAIRSDLDALRIEDLTVSTDLLSGTVTADLTEDGGTAELDLALSDVEPVLGGLSGPGRIAGTATRNPDGTLALDLDATLPTGTASLDGTLSPEDGNAFTGDLGADFTDIAPLGPLVGRDLSGAVQAEVTGTLRPDLSLFDLAFDATTQDLALGLPPLDALLAGEGTHSGRVARTGPDSFAVEDLVIDTPLLDGTVTAAIEDGQGSADLDLTLADVAPVLGGLSGPGRLTGTAATNEDGTLALDLDATLPTGTASVTGTLAPEEGNAFTGDLAADFADIAPLGALLGRDLGGAVDATASGTLRPDLSVLDLTFDATTQDLRTGLPQLDPLLAGPGTFSGQVERSPEGDLALAVTAATPLLNGEAAGTFTQDAGQGSFDLTLPDVSAIAPGLTGPASATGTATRAPDGTLAIDAQATAPGASATIDASVAPPDQGYEITGTVDITAADLAPFSTLAGRPLSGALDATVTGSALPSLESFDLTVDATTQDLSPGEPSLARLLAGPGTLSARLLKDEGGPIRAESLQASFSNLAVTAEGGPESIAFDATLTDLGLFVPEFPGPVTATGTASLGGAVPTVDAQVTGPGGIAAQVTGSVGAVPDLRFAGTAPLALANALLEPRRFEGPASFDLRLTGTSLDALAGTVSLQDARIADPGLGEAITDIDGTATIAGGTATVDLTGALATGGRLAVTGPVALTPPFDASLTILGTGLVIRDPALYETFGNARLTVTGPLAGGALIAGVANLDTVELRVPSSGVGALGEIPDIFHIEPSLPVQRTLARAELSPDGTADAAPEAGAPAPAPGFALDILLNAPARVFIRGRGLDAELGGQLRLTGTTRQVIPVGQFSLLRGRLSILGQRFDLTEGQATIQGDFDPYIRLVAQTEARTGTAISIILEGPLSAPEVTFASQPELPQDEVLAQLLFGVDIESISPLQAIRLASAVATLAGEGTGVLDDIRGEAGLADFDVTTTDSGDIALRLGQYVTENVYTDVVVSPQETEVTINLDLTPDFTVRAGVDTEGETTLGIYFERDY